MRSNQNTNDQNPDEPKPAAAPSPFASFEAALRDEIEISDESSTTEASEVPVRRRRRSGGSGLKINWGFVFRTLLNIAILAVLLLLAWALFLGPLIPVKDNLVKSVAGLLLPPPSSTPTLTFTPEPPKPTRTPRPTYALWTDTPTVSPTAGEATPTSESTATLEPAAILPGGTATPTPGEAAPTPLPTINVEGCTQVENVTSADIGKTMCVTGRVFKVKQTTNQGLNVFTVQLLNSKGFLFVSYDRTWQVNEYACVYATGKIQALGSSTTILLTYSVPLQFCNP